MQKDLIVEGSYAVRDGNGGSEVVAKVLRAPERIGDALEGLFFGLEDCEDAVWNAALFGIVAARKA